MGRMPVSRAVSQPPIRPVATTAAVLTSSAFLNPMAAQCSVLPRRGFVAAG